MDSTFTCDILSKISLDSDLIPQVDIVIRPGHAGHVARPPRDALPTSIQQLSLCQLHCLEIVELGLAKLFFTRKMLPVAP